MTGRITKVVSCFDTGYIRGENGITYVFNVESKPDSKEHYKVGNMVEFDPVDMGRNKLSATNIKLIGKGTRNMYYHSIMKAITFIKENTEDCPDKGRRITELRAAAEYIASLKNRPQQHIVVVKKENKIHE